MKKNNFYNSVANKIQFNDNKYKIKKRINFNESDLKPPTLGEIFWLFVNYVVLIFWAIVILFPVVSLIVTSFNVENERIISILPFKFGFDNFEYLFKSDRSLFGQWYKNTLIIATLTMILSTSGVALNAYAYSRFKFVGSKHSLGIIMLLQLIPATSSLISLFIIVKMGQALGFSPIYMLVIIYTGGSIASNTFLLKGYLDTVSSELDDSGKVDGCTNWGLFFKILLPVIRPALIMVALWSFLIPFTDVILPRFVLFDNSDRTLAVGLLTFIETEPKQIHYGAYLAGSLLASAPAFALFMYLQKYIVGGLSEGAVKG
ncbi:sugar ABC transporter permease [Mycoplasmopsis cricetuli]|uniref:sugar ABC transporter permease n=1 Tax=Mycoplasmopsis cricetuli TaxID=171283 RepID=UPI0004716E71|nr:sugar ABC transporter permease [Mycoplasmopsis cricetuli]